MNFSLRNFTLFLMLCIAWAVGAWHLYYAVIDLSNQWIWIASSAIYVIFINELFFHCTLGHISYKIDTKRIFYKILVFLSSTSLTFGSVRAMIIMHATHHMYADQDDKDYLSLRKRWITAGLISPLMFVYQPYPLSIPDQDKFIEKQSKKFDYLLDDDWTVFCDLYQIILSIVWWAVLYLVFPDFLFKFIMMGRFLMSLFTMLNTIVGHTSLLFGYRNFNTPDHSYNNLLLHYLFLGFFPTLLHNNHHGLRNAETHKHRWWEFDTGALAIKYVIKPLISVKN